METLGQRIKRLRIAKGLSQSSLGAASDCGQSTIATLEKDGRTKRPDLILIAHALGVDAYYLKTGIEPLICGDKTITEVAKLMQECSPVGRAIILDKARDITKEYPNQKQTAA